MSDARDVLHAYFRESEERQKRLRQTKPSDSTARTVLKSLVPVRYRGTSRMILTDLVREHGRRKAQRISRGHQTDLRLHLGSGGEHKSGWVNLDLLGGPVEDAWYLAHPLP